MQVSLLDQRHPEYQENAEFWRDIDLLHRSGDAMRKNASRFLVSRPMEPGQVYQARCAKFTYQGILGTAIGWYVSRFFADEPAIYLKSGDKVVNDDAFAAFLKNADRAGTSLMDLARKWFKRSVIDGSVYVLIDLPASPLARNFHEQKTSGALDPYLVTFNASQVINWGEDIYGNLEWIVIATQRCERAFGAKPKVIDRWYYFDRTDYRIYEAEREEGATAAAGMDSRTAAVVDEGRHALADKNRVPVRRITVPEELWLGYRVGPQIREHLNQDNAYGWALFMSCLPVPVITGEYEEPPTISETAYIKLPEGSKFEWSEPAGTSFQHSAERVEALREEIYRQMYLQAQGRTSTATASASSGYSKQIDMAPSHEVLNGYGAIFRAVLAGISEDAAAIRAANGTEISAEVTGLTFEDDALAEVESCEAALGMDIPSDLFEKWIQKRFVNRFARNADPDTKKAFEQEIDSAPTKSQRAEEEKRALEAGFAGSMQNAMAKSKIAA